MCALDAREMINAESGKHFDPKIVAAFNQCWDAIYELAERTSCDPPLQAPENGSKESKFGIKFTDGPILTTPGQ